MPALPDFSSQQRAARIVGMLYLVTMASGARIASGAKGVEGGRVV